MEINQFIFNDGRSYDDYGLIITETPVFVVPERDVSFESIDGRSGDLIVDNGRFKNVPVEYKVTALCNNMSLPETAQRVSAWLSSPGYGILTDTYDPLYFRYATRTGTVSIKNRLMQLGTATIKFNCKPYKYLHSGRETITLTAPGTINNAEPVASLPYIKITAGGTVELMLNNKSFVFADVDGYVEIDADAMNVFKGTVSKNDKYIGVGFPMFEPGENNITWTGNVSRVEIVPRWCTL